PREQLLEAGQLPRGASQAEGRRRNRRPHHLGSDGDLPDGNHCPQRDQADSRRAHDSLDPSSVQEGGGSLGSVVSDARSDHPVATAPAIASETAPLRSPPIVVTLPKPASRFQAQSSTRNLAGACALDRNQTSTGGCLRRVARE